jgi:hypothetical protein
MNRFYGIGGAVDRGDRDGGDVGRGDRGDLIFLGMVGDPRYVGGRSRWWGVGRGDRGDLIFLGMVGDPRYVGGRSRWWGRGSGRSRGSDFFWHGG